MSKILLSKNHFSATIEKDVEEICSPLKPFGITHFIYSKFYNNGAMYTLTNHWDAYYYHCQRQYTIVPPELDSTRKTYFLSTLNSTSKEYNQAAADWRNLFNLDHGIFFVDRYEDYTELFIYASTPENYKVIDFYLKNIHVLERFKSFFKERAKLLIAKSEKNKIFLPQKMTTNFSAIDEKKIDDPHLIDQLISAKRYSLCVNKKEVKITRKEIDVLIYIARGYTQKEVAAVLNIDPKTVETYLNNVRCKLNVKSRAEIFEVLYQSHFI